MRCGAEIPALGHFCPNCGLPRAYSDPATVTAVAGQGYWPANLPAYRVRKPKPTWRQIVKMILAVMMINFIIALIVMIFTLVAGIDLVAPDILEHNGVLDGIILRLFVMVNVDLVVLSGYSMLGYYLFLVAAIVASSIWIFFTSYEGFAKELTMKATSRDHSPLFDTGGLLFATMLFSVIMGMAFGGMDDIDLDRYSLSELLFLLANAAVWEEIAFRIVLLGLPLLCIDFIRRKSGRKIHRYILGGGFTFGGVEIALVIASSAIFGYAHYDSGWGAWKIVAAGIGGVAMAYLFLKYSLAAAIIMHFATDYLTLPAELLGSNFVLAATAMFVLMALALGAVFMVYYVVRFFEHITNRLYLETKPEVAGVPWAYPGMLTSPLQTGVQGPPVVGQDQTPRSQPPQQPRPGGYICPVCGSTQARWRAGRFQCMRCGHLL